MTKKISRKFHSNSAWVEGLKTVGISLFLAFGIRSFVAEARYIPSGSMEPTLQINDRLLIDKISYDFTAPRRGDVVVFNPTRTLREQNFHDAFIKRIIGLPGETVEISKGQVWINGSPLKEKYIEAPPNYRWGPVVVPANSYLVLGDNRNNSYDSHYWGFVPRNDIVGKAIFRFYPFDRVGELNQPAYVTGQR
jgi:signal peptidase I